MISKTNIILKMKWLFVEKSYAIVEVLFNSENVIFDIEIFLERWKEVAIFCCGYSCWFSF